MNKKKKYKLEPFLKKNKWELTEGVRDVNTSHEEIVRLKNNSKCLVDEIKNSEDILRESISSNNLSAEMYVSLSAYITEQYQSLTEQKKLIKEKENRHTQLNDRVRKLQKLDDGLKKHKEKKRSEYFFQLQEYEANQLDELFNNRVLSGEQDGK